MLSGSAKITAFDRLYGMVAPYAFGAVWLAARAMGASKNDLRARTGALPQATTPLVWLHGASAGEMSAAVILVALLRRNGFRFTAGYTSTNRAGVEYVTRVTEPGTVAALAPWDVRRWLDRAFNCWQPGVLFLVETELWPGLILEAFRRQIPVFLISARIYPHDMGRYRVIRKFIAPTLGRLTAVLTQSETERERLIELGAPPERSSVAGNLKYVGMSSATADREAARAKLDLAGTGPIVVFGSIHADEVDFVMPAVEKLAASGTRIIVAPRHLSSTETIMHATQHRALRAQRRSAGPVDKDWQVLVLDTMGELGCAYNVADVAVVGGGFQAHGGHNPLEPLIGGVPVIFGPYFDHFESESRALASATPQAQVATASNLADQLERWLADGALCRKMLDLQRQTLPDGDAIARQYLAELSPWLEEKCV